MPSTPEVLVGVGEVARKFGVSPSTIRNWEEAGIVPIGARLGGPNGYRVWRPADLDAVTAPRQERRPAMPNTVDCRGGGPEAV